MDWRALSVSRCRTHHLDALEEPAYTERYCAVMSFHLPGLAPASRAGRWFLISADGARVSRREWMRVAGFYEGLCAVESEEGWAHVGESLEPAYEGLWRWAGNFQQGRCTVQAHDGSFLHIDRAGQRRSGPWTYAGDYREGIAAVRTTEGWSLHVDRNGEQCHGSQFLEAREYHKGRAVVRDVDGYYHVDLEGRPCGSRRYESLEPFYNGRAYALRKDGMRVVLLEDDTEVEIGPMNAVESRNRLLADALAWWKTLAVREQLLANDARVPGLAERDPRWLRRLAYWTDLAPLTVLERYRTGLDAFEVAKSLGRQEELAHVLNDYAEEDWPEVAKTLDLPASCTIVDVGGGLGSLLRRLMERFPGAKGILVDRGEVLQLVQDHPRVTLRPTDMFREPIPEGDVYLLTRVLHDWSEFECVTLLRNISVSADSGSLLVIVEHDIEMEPAPLLQAYLAAIGGKERTRDQYGELLRTSGWKAHRISRRGRFMVIEATRS